MKRLLPFILASLCAVALAQVFSLRDVAFGSRPVSYGVVFPTDYAAHWRLDETSGTRVGMSNGTNDTLLTLTDENTVGYTTGVITNAALFVDADNEALTIRGQETPPAALPAAYSMVAFIKCTTINVGYGTILNRISVSTEGFHLYTIGTDIRFGVYDTTSGWTTATNSTVATTNVWYFVYAWAKAGAIGIRVNTTTNILGITAGPSQTDGHIGIGRWSENNNNAFNGAIDEVFLFYRELTDSEQAAFYSLLP